MSSRGIRNNNPLNIRKGKDSWVGKVGDDGQFVIFDTMTNGLRAAFRNLRTYHKNYKIRTITGIINRWAPSVENNTQAYIRYVVDKTVFTATQELNFDFQTYAPIVKAMSQLESNYTPSEDELISAWNAI